MRADGLDGMFTGRVNAMSAGRSLRRAADMVEIIERSAEIILGCYALGKEPPTLPEELVATPREIGA